MNIVIAVMTGVLVAVTILGAELRGRVDASKEYAAALAASNAQLKRDAEQLRRDTDTMASATAILNKCR